MPREGSVYKGREGKGLFRVDQFTRLDSNVVLLLYVWLPRGRLFKDLQKTLIVLFFLFFFSTFTIIADVPSTRGLRLIVILVFSIFISMLSL